jgi:UDP-N-acetylglucosamine transferase subunit ALG13
VTDVRPFVFVTVGTDHHPFNRLVGWTDRWLAAQPGVEGLIQHGASAPPERSPGLAYLGYEEMERAMRRAAAVVTHGGPGSIMLCSALGGRAIVVPRRAALGEHVDDHQVVFCRRLAGQGAIALAESEEQLAAMLERAAAAGRTRKVPVERAHIARAVREVEVLIDGLVGAAH